MFGKILCLMPKSRICSELSVLVLYSRLLLLADCIVNHLSPGCDLTPCFSLRSPQWMKEGPSHNPTYEPLTNINGLLVGPFFLTKYYLLFFSMQE
jgi:hypothetical protein